MSEQMRSPSGEIAEPYADYLKTDFLLDDLHRRSFRAGVVTVSGQAANFFLQIGATAILARLLLPRDFGLVSMVTAITGFIALFKDLGLSAATIQRAEVTHGQVSFLFWVNLAMSVVVAVVVIGLAPVIAWFYHEPRLTWITLLLSLNFIFGGLTAQHQALLRRRMQFKTLAVIDVTSNVVGQVVGIAIALLGGSFWALVCIRSATSITNCVQVWLKSHWRPGWFRRHVGARSMMAFGRNLTVFNVVNYFTRNADNVLIGRALGAGPLGIYAKAYGLLLLPASQINVPVSAVLLPALSRLQKKPKEYYELFMNGAGALALVAVPIVVFSVVFARDIVLVLLGRRWLSVAPVFQLLGPAALVSAVGTTPFWLCQSLGRTKRQVHFALLSAPITVGGFVVGLHWGVAGVAASFSLTFGILYWWFVWYASHDSPVPFSAIFGNFLAAFLPAVAAAVLSAGLRYALLAHIDSRVLFALCTATFMLSYLGMAIISQRSRFLIRSGAQNLRTALHM